jgi:transketolase
MRKIDSRGRLGGIDRQGRGRGLVEELAMQKIREIVKQIGGSDQLADQLVEAVEGHVGEERKKLQEEYQAKIQQAKKICLEEVAAEKQRITSEMSKKISRKKAKKIALSILVKAERERKRGNSTRRTPYKKPAQSLKGNNMTDSQVEKSSTMDPGTKLYAKAKLRDERYVSFYLNRETGLIVVNIVDKDGNCTEILRRMV